MQAGEIVSIKTTGEKVFLRRYYEDSAAWDVRRPTIDDEGKIFHTTEVFYENELETIEENLNRQIDEMLLKTRLQQRLYPKEATEIPRLDPSIN